MDKEILERAIKGNDMCREKYNCSECPYHGLHYCHSILCRESRDLLKEQQDLLKEQEAKPVSQIRKIAYRTIGDCPSCGRVLDSYEDGNSGNHITRYCYNCGQAVRWE